MSKYDIPVEFADNLKIFMKGMKRHVAAKKWRMGTAESLVRKKWILRSTKKYVSCLCQTGRNSDQVWHVYATPNNACVCPVLALATYIFANPSLTNFENFTEANEDGNVSGRLFPGGDQYGRFMDCLRRVVEKNKGVFLALGIRPGDLGSHSARKGACSFAAAGSTVCPPMVSICLRAMWSMGSVKERYLQFEKAGDQYLGRVVSGLDVNDVSFAISPPYFECCENEDDVREKILTLLKEFTVGGHGIRGEIFQLLYFCFASLCYHFDFLVEVLPKQNKLQASPFFTHIPNYAREAATVRFPWNKTASTPLFTGLPPHVSILAQIESLKVALEEAKDSIISGLKADLDGRRLGSQSYFDKEEIIEKMGELHNELLRRVEVVGRRSATALQAGENDAGHEVTAGGSDSVSSLSVDASASVTLVEQGSGKKYQYFYSAGAMSRVPANFVFPKMSLMTLITSWFCSNESMKTVPFKLLAATEIKNTKERYKLSQMKTLMLVEIAAKRVGTWDAFARRGAWEVGSTVRLFESVHHFFWYPSKIKRRNAQISWQTVFNLFKSHGKVFATDLD